MVQMEQGPAGLAVIPPDSSEEGRSSETGDGVSAGTAATETGDDDKLAVNVQPIAV